MHLVFLMLLFFSLIVLLVYSAHSVFIIVTQFQVNFFVVAFKSIKKTPQMNEPTKQINKPKNTNIHTHTHTHKHIYLHCLIFVFTTYTIFVIFNNKKTFKRRTIIFTIFVLVFDVVVVVAGWSYCTRLSFRQLFTGP